MEMPAEKRRFTINEYLRLERDSLERHDYLDGEILAMAGGSYEHSLICANVIGELRAALKDKPCRVLESNLRVGIPRTPIYTYPDASVICGKPQHDPRDETHHTLLNPTVVLEVLSPTTEGYDRGEKFTRFRQLDSLQEYVLIRQDAPSVEVFFRREEGTWLFTPVSGIEAKISLASLGIVLPLAEIFAGVEFVPEKADGTAPKAF